MLNVRPFDDFDSAAQAVLAYLQRRLGFDLWLLTRVVDDEWVILKSRDASYGIEDPDTLRWVAGYCSRMLMGRSPNIRPRAADVQTFVQPPDNAAIPIGAYLGVPLKRADGSLFGTLCAIHPQPMPEIVAGDLPLVELLARTLTTLLEKDLRAKHESRRADSAEQDALVDSLTHVYNRRGWDQMLTREEDRCARYGYPACVCVVDLDRLKEVNDEQGHAAGDELLISTGQVLVDTVREHDVVARVGGDEFAVLGVECDADKAASLVERLRAALKRAGIQASVGVSLRAGSHNLNNAWEQADAAMYVSKNASRKLRENKAQNS